MTVNVTIRPEVEARLAARARSIGESLEAFIQRLLESEAAAVESDGLRVLSGPEKADAFEAWTKSFPPVLSLDDISREKLYQRE